MSIKYGYKNVPLRKRPERPMQSQVRKTRLSDQARKEYAFVHWVNSALDAEFKRLVERDE